MEVLKQQLEPTEEFTHDFIPIHLWGKDHWSTLAYLETHDVDRGGFKVQFDPRMRQNRRNFRIMPKSRQSQQEMGIGVVMHPEYGSRLNNGKYAKNHDDWNCVQDFAEAGFLRIGENTITAEEVQPNEVLHLTDLGRSCALRLREHKAKGGTFSNFKF
jgi:hypothetical protein